MPDSEDRLPAGTEVCFSDEVITRTNYDPDVAGARGHVVENRGRTCRVVWDGHQRLRTVPTANLRRVTLVPGRLPRPGNSS